MKSALIALSLLINVVLVLVVTRSPVAPPIVRDFFSRHGSSSATAASTGTTAKSPDAVRPAASSRSAPLWSTLASDDPATLVARLRAAGFPASLIRAVVSAQINARYNERMRTLNNPDPNLPFWKSSSTANTARYDESVRLQQERSRMLRDLFKDDFFASSDVSAAQRRQFGNLPAAKIEQLQRIEDDYAEMNRTLSTATKGVTLPEDREKFALLTREKQADLAAVLSATELADYSMRSSPITTVLRGQLGAFDPTEAEYRVIFQMQQTLNEQFPVYAGSGGSISLNNEEQRRALQPQLEQELKTTLGDARYADYTREIDREYQQLKQLAQRDDLPLSVSREVFALRDTVAQQSNRIFDDSSLDPTQKRAALQALAQNTRAQLLSRLGPTSGPAYVKVADAWLTNVERGSAVSFNSGSGGWTGISSGGGIVTLVSVGGITPNYRRLPAPPANP